MIKAGGGHTQCVSLTLTFVTVILRVFFLIVCYVLVFYIFFCCSVCKFCTGHFVMVSLHLTYLQCLQRSFFEHLFNLYVIIFGHSVVNIFMVVDQTFTL